MPPWRIQHESHTCSEQSLRILKWNSSYMQKALQLYLTGMGRWKDPTSTIAIASARCKELEADTSVQLSQIVPTMTNCDHSAVMKRHEMKRLAGSGLSRWPWRYQKEMKLNENGSKPWTPGDHNLAGTHGWSVRASWDACKELRCAELCKSPLPPCCKYGKEVKQHPQKHMKSKGR